MKNDIDIRTYFNKCKDMDGSGAGTLTRASNGLVRSEIYTMNQLCEMPLDELNNVRNIGGKTIKLILRIRERYIAEVGR